MKQIKQFFCRLFNRRQPTYGAQIFQQRSWLTKQVDDALWKKYQGLN
jgi:2,4-dienoyl-CoA reductase-like NADH-dependent reductase (Old Yellow Enzyme family)